MGAMCGCGNETKDISTFWRGLEIRKITFDQYITIFERNQKNWLSSGDANRVVDIRKCNELFKLLHNNEFSEKERIVFFDRMNEFVNNQYDKLTFFTCLSFFTRLNESELAKRSLTSSAPSAEQYIESLRTNERDKNFEIVFEHLLRLAIKKKDHEDVTKLFVQLITEVPLNFVYLSQREREEKSIIFSKENREILFNNLKGYPSKKFYEYIFSKDNVAHINNDLLKISSSNGLKDDLIKVRTTSVLNNTTPRPAGDQKLDNRS